MVRDEIFGWEYACKNCDDPVYIYIENMRLPAKDFHRRESACTKPERIFYSGYVYYDQSQGGRP